jgi:hypothetical protein
MLLPLRAIGENRHASISYFSIPIGGGSRGVHIPR